MLQLHVQPLTLMQICLKEKRLLRYDRAKIIRTITS